MRGHIRKRNKSWEIIVEYPRNSITNKRNQKSFTVKGTKKDAEQFLTNKLKELDNGVFVDSKNMNLTEYLEYWYNEYCIRNLTPTTYEGYKRNIDKHIIPILGNIKLKDLKPLHLQNFYSNRLENNLSKTSVNNLHKIIHKALEQAKKWQLISLNIADNVEPPKKQKYNANILTPTDLENLLKLLDKKDIIYIPIMIAISTGMRRGEILGLNWGNIDLENGIIKVVQALYPTKTGLQILKPKTKTSIRAIYIPTTLIEILKEYKMYKENLNLANNYNMVCSLENGEYLSPSTLNHRFKNFLEINNLPHIRFHDLRHSHASLLLMQGVQPKMISERLGHSNIAITMDLYSHIYEESNKEVANNFDALLKTS